MTDYPINCSAPEVRALLEGRKAMARQPAWRSPGPNHHFPTPSLPSPWQRVKPGERLWVREAWKPHSIYAAIKPRHVPESRVFYCADERYAPSGAWRPSIHMPRWASRLTLIVTETRMERLQAIDEVDALAEGCAPFWDKENPVIVNGMTAHPHADAREAFRRLWNSLHGPGSWDANPEVVALRFTVERRNIDAKEAA
ncbi:MAG: hypothetical protein KIT32_12150 [Rhodocyclaceae bacterium]|nr:hypothetical protein [Rhodocyclaceae bacterium]